MTLLSTKEVYCVNCRKTSTWAYLQSWHQFDAPRYQLDLRDLHAPKGLLALGLQRCRYCHHTAPDIGLPPSDQMREVLGKFDPELYQIGTDGTCGDVIGLILHAEQCVAASQRAESARAQMAAAWLLDDLVDAGRQAVPPDLDAVANKESLAQLLRRLAASNIKSSQGTDRPFGTPPMVWAVHADLLRRAGAFARAAVACREALKGHEFGTDEELTVRDMLHHILNLATDQDARAGWVSDAEARAVDYPERLERRRAAKAAQQALERARTNARDTEYLIKVAPLRLIEWLTEIAEIPLPAGSIESWPIPDWLQRVMIANSKAYHWPQDILGPVMVAALARVLDSRAAKLAPYLSSHAGLLSERQAEISYLAHCLRDTSAAQWFYRAPPEGFLQDGSTAVPACGTTHTSEPGERPATVQVPRLVNEATPDLAAPRPDSASDPRSMSDLKAAFRRSFHIELPPEFDPAGLKAIGGERLLSSHPQLLPQLLMGPFNAKRFQELEDGHRTVGFWGYGSNSYYFYFISKLPGERIYLRLHTGWVYTDAKAAAAEITDFVPVMVWLIREVRRLKGMLFAIQSAGQGEIYAHYRGVNWKLSGSLLGQPDAMNQAQRFIDGLSGAPPAFDPSDLQREALKLAQAIYLEESRVRGNERVGMRALGAVMDIIRGTSLAPSAAAYQHETLLSLAGLAERHQDLDGEHDRARAAIRRFVAQLRSAWSLPRAS